MEKLLQVYFPREIEEITYIPLPTETKPKMETETNKPDYLTELCLAIRDFEGWEEGSRSWRNNNPGNCRYSSVGYLPKYGEVKRDAQNFAIFKDYGTGWMYLKNLVFGKAQKHPEWNLVSFFKEYAPTEDNNNPQNYASWVAKKIGVNVFTWQLKELLN